MAGLWCTGNTGNDDVDAQEITCRIAPWHESLGRAPVPDSLEAMAGAAQSQVRWLRSQPDGVGGGRLIVAELTRDAMEIRSVRSLQEA